MMNKRRGRGRPRGETGAREEILETARGRFLTDGYERVTLRSIAADAGVDVALISYHFGSKRGLFAATMQLAANPPDVLRAALPGELGRLPERLLPAMLSIWDDAELGTPLHALYRSAGHDPDMTRLLREMIGRELIGQIAEHLSGDDASARAGVVASQVAGMIFMRYVLEVEPLVSMPAEEVVTLMAPAMRAALVGAGGGRRVPGHQRLR